MLSTTCALKAASSNIFSPYSTQPTFVLAFSLHIEPVSGKQANSCMHERKK